jgi:hypothetical protein
MITRISNLKLKTRDPIFKKGKDKLKYLIAILFIIQNHVNNNNARHYDLLEYFLREFAKNSGFSQESSIEAAREKFYPQIFEFTTSSDASLGQVASYTRQKLVLNNHEDLLTISIENFEDYL